MSQPQTVLEGVVHGRTIELEHEPGLPDGQEVTVSIQPSAMSLVPGEGIRRSAGVWADDPDGLEEYLEWNRRQRRLVRPEIEPRVTCSTRTPVRPI